MSDPSFSTIAVGAGPAGRDIAILSRPGGSPGLFFLGGFRSDMAGSKAEALDALAAEHGLAMTRFDYSGHGRSGGRFEDGTITRWLEEARAVFATTAGPQVVIGSSMGGGLALLLAVAERAADGGSRVAGLVLIAPAVDMTRALMWDAMDRKARKAVEEAGVWHRPSAHGEPYPITRGLIEDGDRHLFGDRLIETGCPVHILQGVLDADVPWRHAQALVAKLATDDVVLTLVKDGDHRLSRPEDLARLRAAVTALAGEVRP